MTLTTSLALLASLFAAQAPGEVTPKEKEERLALMKESVAGYEITRSDDRAASIRVMPEPAFRIGKQGVGDLTDGAIFLWTDEVGRPEAAMQMFLLKSRDDPQGTWLHEFTSLSTRPIVAVDSGVTKWRPARAGLVFLKLDGAPKPATTPTQRLRQMRDLAGGFRGEDNFGDRGWRKVRMLTTPIARYGQPGRTPEDGALFAFVEGTDPEVFLFIEARPGAGGLEWQYALAPMTCYALKVERDGREVWTLPRRDSGDPSLPFFDMRYEPRPSSTSTAAKR